jgi:hypothetical protein
VPLQHLVNTVVEMIEQQDAEDEAED